jgi:sulfite exporter TauE/SafE
MLNAMSLALVSGASLAAASSAHCALMCGPLALSSTSSRGGSAARYFTGRVVSYTLLGALSGSVGKALLGTLPARYLEAAVSWSLAVALAVAAYPHLRSASRAAPAEAAVPLIALGARRKAQPISRLFSALVADPLLLGVATALLPCGALYAAVAGAAALAEPLPSALMMATFACITGLSLLGFASLGARLHALTPSLRRGLGAVLLVGAAIMAVRPIPLLRGGDPAKACIHCRGEAP